MAEHDHHVRFAPMMRVRSFAESPAFKQARVPKLIKPYDNDASGVAKLIKNSKASTAASQSLHPHGSCKDNNGTPRPGRPLRSGPATPKLSKVTVHHTAETTPRPVHAGYHCTLTSRDLNIGRYRRHVVKGSIDSIVRPTTFKALKTQDVPTETFVALRKRVSAWALHCAIEMQEAVLEMERDKDHDAKSLQSGHDVLPTASETAV